MNNNKNLTIVQMGQTDNNEKFHRLRNTYPLFIYDEFSFIQSENNLTLRFVFNVGQSYCFRPCIRFKGRVFGELNMSEQTARSLAFHIGMVEIISYWKAFCCPQILIRPFKLTGEQQKWWQKLFLHGLGEFYHTNGIAADSLNMVSFSSEIDANKLPAFPGNSFLPDGSSTPKDEPEGNGNDYRQMPGLSNTGHDPYPGCASAIMDSGVIVPVGGGKDSAVTIELLKQYGDEIFALVVNQRPATKRIIRAAGITEAKTISIERTIDPLLLRLNEQGYLNGHTPFSALLAFISAFSAYAHRVSHIALSNESSANEPTIPGTTINHQYSKSYEFEHDFRSYLHQYIHPTINYFSFLRPLNEIQIAALFSGMGQYHPIFRSCNAGSRNDTWCGRCPKCLFTYIILLPFLHRKKLVEIFGANLLESNDLKETLDELTGFVSVKPFECVGTIGEVNATLSHIKKRHEADGASLPCLLRHYAQNNGQRAPDMPAIFDYIHAYNGAHFLPQEFNIILQKSIENIHLIQLHH